MADEDKPWVQFDSLEAAAELGFDAEHIAEHMISTVLCHFDGAYEGLDLGFYFQFRDNQQRVWTLSVIPEDGGVISDALLHAAQEELG